MPAKMRWNVTSLVRIKLSTQSIDAGSSPIRTKCRIITYAVVNYREIFFFQLVGMKIFSDSGQRRRKTFGDLCNCKGRVRHSYIQVCGAVDAYLATAEEQATDY